MRRFNISVNGVSYDVCVEEGGSGAPMPAAPAAAAPVAAPVAAPAPAAAPAAAPAPTGAAGSVVINCPMPGTIMKVNVSVGQTVAEGDILLTFEAMKMENEICAPQAGTVASVSVKAGDAVNSNDLLLTMN